MNIYNFTFHILSSCQLMDSIRNRFSLCRITAQNAPLPELIAAPSFSNAGDDDRSNPNGEAPILAACHGKNLPWVQELLENDPTLVNRSFLAKIADSTCHVYPLFIAARYGHLDVAKCLIKAISKAVGTLPEADKSTAARRFLSAACQDGATALFIAAQNGHLDVAKCLIEALNEAMGNLPEADKSTAVRVFLSSARENGASALFISAQNGHLGVAKYLIEVLNEAVGNLPEVDKFMAVRRFLSAPCKSGATALYIAGQNGHLGVAK
ncbi:ankyrin repeat domain-containing protein, partial [Endozoicomonas sp. ONNA2]|uniref:ankyrin repeat domain-containing protein n=1 Tax=Endozoicomonas sp. ONNA2 TaxID=2828741 RepID=UPI002148D613